MSWKLMKEGGKTRIPTPITSHYTTRRWCKVLQCFKRKMRPIKEIKEQNNCSTFSKERQINMVPEREGEMVIFLSRPGLWLERCRDGSGHTPCHPFQSSNQHIIKRGFCIKVLSIPAVQTPRQRGVRIPFLCLHAAPLISCGWPLPS